MALPTTWFSQPGWYSNSPREMLPSEIKSVTAEFTGTNYVVDVVFYSQFTMWVNLGASVGIPDKAWNDAPRKDVSVFGLQNNAVQFIVPTTNYATHAWVRLYSGNTPVAELLADIVYDPALLKTAPVSIYIRDVNTGMPINGAKVQHPNGEFKSGSTGVASDFLPDGSWPAVVSADNYNSRLITVETVKVLNGQSTDMYVVDLIPGVEGLPVPVVEPPSDEQEGLAAEFMGAGLAGVAVGALAAAGTKMVDALKIGLKVAPVPEELYGGLPAAKRFSPTVLTKINKLKAGGAVLTGLSILNAGAAFGDFILEEAMQTAMFPVSVLMREKKWKEASRQLEYCVELWHYVKEYRDTAGKMNWITGPAFEANLQAVASALIEYKKIVDDNYNKDLEIPDQLDVIAREITDGDTFVGIWNGRRISVRVVGINTPESGEPYYSDAKRALFRFIWGQKVKLKLDPANFEDNNGRALAVVELDGVNINLAMVSQGWAFYYPLQAHKFIDDAAFKAAEAEAKQNKRGIWGLINRANLSMPEGKIPTTAQRTAIKISSLPSRAVIFLDGEYTYKLTPETLDVSPGKHLYKVSASGYNDEIGYIDVPDGAVVEHHVKLTKL